MPASHPPARGARHGVFGLGGVGRAAQHILLCCSVPSRDYHGSGAMCEKNPPPRVATRPSQTIRKPLAAITGMRKDIDRKLIARYAIRETMGLVVMGVALFWSAGRIDWWPAWASIAVIWLCASSGLRWRDCGGARRLYGRCGAPDLSPCRSRTSLAADRRAVAHTAARCRIARSRSGSVSFRVGFLRRSRPQRGADYGQ